LNISFLKRCCSLLPLRALYVDIHVIQIFDKLPKEEKKFWHSHKYEVNLPRNVVFLVLRFGSKIESGLLQLEVKGAVPGKYSTLLTTTTTTINPLSSHPGFVLDVAEQPTMLYLYKTYGKTIHTWAIDVTPDLPLGPPNLMMSYTGDGQMDPAMVKARDKKIGLSTEASRKLRASYLPSSNVKPGADEWEKTGKGVEFSTKEVSLIGN
jgi:hypothetical protein